jgi:hypothetical protein
MAGLKSPVDRALAEERVRLVFQLWEETGSVTVICRRMGCWSRQMVHQVLHGESHRKVAPDLQRLQRGHASRRCDKCEMWRDPRPATEWDDGSPGRCSLGIPESSDQAWARLCPNYVDRKAPATGRSGRA